MLLYSGMFSPAPWSPPARGGETLNATALVFSREALGNTKRFLVAYASRNDNIQRPVDHSNGHGDGEELRDFWPLKIFIVGFPT